MSELEDQLKKELRIQEINEAALRGELQVAEARVIAAEEGMERARKLVEMMRAVMMEKK